MGVDLNMPELDLDAPRIRWHVSGINTNENPWTEDDFDDFYQQIDRRLRGRNT